MVTRFLALLLLVTLTHATETYLEHLDIRHLPGRKVHTEFTFTSTSTTVNGRDFNILPRPLVQIILSYEVEELSLTLTQGMWRDQLWGFTENTAPPGAQFLVWFGGKSETVDTRWKHVRNSISGITCASLGSLSSEDTISPLFSLRPTGLTSTKGDRRYVRYGVSPAEVVCTENLTPWLKLLPCSSSSGLASLLDSSKIYNTAYHSLSLTVKRIQMGEEIAWVIEQRISLVFAPLQLYGRASWSMKGLLGRTLVDTCPVASSTMIDVVTPEGASVTPNLHTPLTSSGVVGVTFDAGNITQTKILNVAVNIPDQQTAPAPVVPAAIHVHTYISRISSSSSGHIVTLFTNNRDSDITVLYLQVVPWWLRIYVHTMSITNLSSLNGGSPISHERLHLELARDRKTPYTLEIVFTVPARSTAKFIIQFDPLLLRWNEYPPDAHHGRHIPSGVVSYHDNEVVRLYSDSPLVYLPTPDFSMPFNVLCLVSTVIAIVYGSIFSLTTKELACVKENEVKKGLLLQLITALRGALRKQETIEVNKNEIEQKETESEVVSEPIDNLEGTKR